MFISFKFSHPNVRTWPFFRYAPPDPNVVRIRLGVNYKHEIHFRLLHHQNTKS